MFSSPHLYTDPNWRRPPQILKLHWIPSSSVTYVRHALKTDHLDNMLRRNQNSLLTVFMNPKFRAVVRDRLAFLAVGVLFPEKF